VEKKPRVCYNSLCPEREPASGGEAMMKDGIVLTYGEAREAEGAGWALAVGC